MRYSIPMALLLCFAARAGADSHASLITERGVRAHMEFLAGDALNGRASGSRDEWLAASYLASRMLAIGLEPLGDAGSFVQVVDSVRTLVDGSPELQVGAHRLLHGEQILVMDLDAASAVGSLQKFRPGALIQPGAALLMPPAAAPLDAKGLEAASLLLWRENTQLRSQWKSLGARQLTVGSTRLLGVAANAPVASPVQIVLGAAAYDALGALAENTQVRFAASTRELSGRTWNAAGSLPGADPAQREQVILLTAHLDHLGAGGDGPDRIYNGADDDASGCIAVLSLAEAMARLPRPKRSIVFAFFGSEEAGSVGAKFFLAKSTVPLDRIITNLQFEMIGRSDPAVADHTLWLTGWERTDLGPALAAHGARLVRDPHPKENFFLRSDNITLARRGVIAQTVSSYGLHEQYHQPDDDIAHIDFRHMTDSIRSLLPPVQWLANSKFRPQWLPGGRPPAGR